MYEFDDDTIARTATEDEEAAAEVHAVRLTCPALTMLSREYLKQHPDGKVPVELLVLGVTDASQMLLNHTSREGGTVALGACPPHSPPEAAVATTRGVLSVLRPKGIVLMTDLHEQAISKSSLQEAQQEFYVLGTSATSKFPAGLHMLPAGCTIPGMAAAVLSAAEARAIPAVAVISVVRQAFTDVTRKHLSALASQVSLAAKACVPETDIPILQQAACEAPLRSPWEAPRVYL